MKKLIQKIFAFIKKLYNKLVDETKELVPVAIKVVEGIKKVMDSPVDDVTLAIIATIIPALPKDKISYYKLKLEDYLPKLILELNLVNTIANETDVNKQLQMILEQLKLSSDEVKAEKYHALASKILVILSDGKVTWSEAVILTEWYYQDFLKNNEKEFCR